LFHLKCLPLKPLDMPLQSSLEVVRQLKLNRVMSQQDGNFSRTPYLLKRLSRH